MIVTRRSLHSVRFLLRNSHLLSAGGLLAAALLSAGCVSGDDATGSDDSAVMGTDSADTNEPVPPPAGSEGDTTVSNDDTSAPTASVGETDSMDGTGEPVDGPDVVVGTFAVEITGDSTGVQGKVKNGEDSANMVWDTLSTVGDCEVRIPRIPDCTPACADTDACVEENICRVIPASVSVGDVLVSGVSHGGSTEAVKLRSIVKNYQTPADVSWDVPPFAPGDPINLSASGGDVQPFTIDAFGISPIVVTSEPPEMAVDMPINLSWEAEVGAIETAIYVRIDVSHHGGTRGLIECETSDDGELTIDAALVKDLMDQGVSGFPNIRITRSNIGSTATSVGVVQLKINSILQQDITIEGIASCNTTDECAAGLTCEADRVCR